MSLSPSYQAEDVVLLSYFHKPCTLETGFSKSHRVRRAGQGPTRNMPFPRSHGSIPNTWKKWAGDLEGEALPAHRIRPFPFPLVPPPVFLCVLWQGAPPTLGQPPAFPSHPRSHPADAATAANPRCSPVPRLPRELTAQLGGPHRRRDTEPRAGTCPGPTVSGRGGAVQGTTTTTQGQAQLPLGIRLRVKCIHLYTPLMYTPVYFSF